MRAHYVHYHDSTGGAVTHTAASQLAAETLAFEMLETGGGVFEWESREVVDGVLYIAVGGQDDERGTWTITVESH